MTPLTVTIPFLEHVQLLANSITLKNLIWGTLPALFYTRFALFGILLWALFNQWQIHRLHKEVKQLLKVIDDMHAEDVQREKFPESVKEADSRVVYEAHREL
jgi:hypothetical protein